MTDLILRIVVGGGYWGIALLMALENVFPPIPSEVIMGFGGLGVARGEFAFVPLVVVATAGATAGNLFWYCVGRQLGIERLRPFVERHGRWLTLEWRDVERMRAQLHSRGGWIVFAFRFLPTFRTMISLPAGMADMPVWRFLAFTFAGTGLWNAALAGAGYVLGRRFSLVDTYLGHFGLAVIALAVAAYLWRVVTWRPRAS